MIWPVRYAKKYPDAKPGDEFGNVRIVSVYRGTIRTELRAVIECKTCGVRSESYVFNLRGKPNPCVKKGKCR